MWKKKAYSLILSAFLGTIGKVAKDDSVVEGWNWGDGQTRNFRRNKRKRKKRFL